MKLKPLDIGRTIAVTFEHGEDFFKALRGACEEAGVRQGYIPLFLAGMSEAELAGTCQKPEDPEAPVWSAVHLTNLEAVGAGSLAWDEESQTVSPHIHLSVGARQHGALGYTSHLLAATVQFLTEMIIVEVTAPQARRVKNRALYDVPVLTFED
ncbi:PPC domain-containing DNA-binding protein [Glycomyces tenuis]|uniref:PPC domain-containing DNA-binding protein n=1 Tax=Glycomyces tenuis TaxID=58116 RepID=UPI000418FA9B|nr:PPC domain-containing DNA-binding protein [Glycomyces tenuis]